MTNGQRCPACNGNHVVESQKTGLIQTCPLCQGTGRFWNYDPKPRWYIFNQIIAAALGTAQGALNIDAQADFQLVWLTRTASTGVFTSRFTDNSGRAWDNLAVNDLNRFGTAQQPFPVGISPVILRAQSSLQITLTDTSAVAGNVIQLAFIGYDLYPLAA